MFRIRHTYHFYQNIRILGYALPHGAAMVNKLTLNVDADVVAAAKAYARAHGTSVSRLVEAYLERLALRDGAAAPPSPWIRRVVGSVAFPEGFDERAALREYRERKHG
jgi:hypothetical protein